MSNLTRLSSAAQLEEGLGHAIAQQVMEQFPRRASQPELLTCRYFGFVAASFVGAIVLLTIAASMYSALPVEQSELQPAEDDFGLRTIGKHQLSERFCQQELLRVTEKLVSVVKAPELRKGDMDAPIMASDPVNLPKPQRKPKRIVTIDRAEPVTPTPVAEPSWVERLFVVPNSQS